MSAIRSQGTQPCPKCPQSSPQHEPEPHIP
jgi:hypothetical protein